VGTTVQDDAHSPQPWRTLTASEQARFDTGYAVFNTEWAPANSPPGRIDGLGPSFNSQSCDSCHNSRRRGRGPRADGEAPSDLVIQLGQKITRTYVARGNPDYGYVLNTSAIRGFRPEARVSIAYEIRSVTLSDGTIVELREPRYQVRSLDGPKLLPNTVLMPRMPPPVQGAGLLELVPSAELERVSRLQHAAADAIRGRVGWLQTNTHEAGAGRANVAADANIVRVPANAHTPRADIANVAADVGRPGARTHGSRADAGRVVGRFGWQASEPTVASQIGVAFAREMGLTNPLESTDDCEPWNDVCRTAPSGGSPEVEPELFDAVVAFERWHSVPVVQTPDLSSQGARLFAATGCAQCHRTTLRIDAGTKDDAVIHPYTDLLLHEMGDGLADRTLDGCAVPGLWRTAPLWGMHAASVSGQPIHLLHDGRARSIEEAILWHDSEARAARERYAHSSAAQRRILTEWIGSL
jgi:CxxC motif-containing protein (DUF1111 family)